MLGAFLDAENIAIGPIDDVKAVIDVLKKKSLLFMAYGYK